MHLLSGLTREGGAELLRKMQGFPELDSVSLESSEPPDSRISCKVGDRSVCIYVFEMEDLFSIHVVTEEPQPEQVPTDLRHRGFCERWEAMPGMDFDEETGTWSEADRAVYRVALPECGEDLAGLVAQVYSQEPEND